MQNGNSRIEAVLDERFEEGRGRGREEGSGRGCDDGLGAREEGSGQKGKESRRKTEAERRAKAKYPASKDAAPEEVERILAGKPMVVERRVKSEGGRVTSEE